MTFFSREYYETMKDYFHPNVHTFIDRYTDDEGLVLLPPFHGCNLRNRNGSRKLIDYRNGKQCLFPLWSDDKSKLKAALFALTRYMTFGKNRYRFKNKGNCIFNYTLNKYVHLSDTPIQAEFSSRLQAEFLEQKEKYLKDDTK